MYKTAHPSYTRMPAEMVYFHYLVWHLHGSGAYQWYMLIALFYGVIPSLWHPGQSARLEFDVPKVSFTDKSYAVTSFLISTSRQLVRCIYKFLIPYCYIKASVHWLVSNEPFA